MKLGKIPLQAASAEDLEGEGKLHFTSADAGHITSAGWMLSRGMREFPGSGRSSFVFLPTP